MKSEVVLTIRMEEALRDKLRAHSQANNNSINREVVEMVRRAVNRRKKEKAE